MKDKILTAILNLFKVKSIVTFATVYIVIYLVKSGNVDVATVMVLATMVFKNLFDKEKDGDSK